MKIGIVCNPWLGGAGALPTELGKALAASGHEVHFFAFDIPFRLAGPWRQNIFFHKIESLDYPAYKNPPDSLVGANLIYNIAIREGIQILNAHFAGVNSETIYLAQKMLKESGIEVKTVNTLHGSDVSILSQDQLIKDSLAFLLKKSDVVTCVSKSLAEEAGEKFGLKNVKVIYNFINEHEFKPIARNRDLRNIFAKPNEKIIFHSSNFRSVKRIQDVIKLFHLIDKKIPSKLLLAGEGPDQQIATSLAAKYKIIDRIHFLGFQSNLNKLLSISDLFLLPSEKENFSLSALEAMVCGVPVISTNVGGMSEMIDNSKNGYLAEIGDIDSMAKYAINLFTQKDLYEQISSNARKKVTENFIAEKIVPQYEKLFQDLCHQIKKK